MLDTVGETRGADTSEQATLQATWKGAPVQNFSSASELEAWEKNWPNGDGRLRLKSFTIPQREKSEYLGVPEGSFSKELFL